MSATASAKELARPAPRPLAAGATLVVRRVAAPVVDLDAAAAALAALVDAGAPAFLWAPPAGPAVCGAGAAADLRAAGADRFAAIAAQADELWAHLDADGGAPRLWGGLAFSPGGAATGAWRGFGDASFVLPRWSYTIDGDAAQLVLIAPAGERGAEAALREALAALATARPPTEATPPLRHVREDHPAWTTLVDQALAAIAAGAAEKIVAARRQHLELAGAIDARAVLARLAGEAASAYRFAHARGGAWFVGATPERLVRKSGLTVESEALAGTSPAGHAAELLESRKDLAEHDPVVRAVVAALAPRCAELVVPSRPEVRELPHVTHLRTPVRGRLHAPTHVLELAAALHPTPAVGGLPREAALGFIATHEAPRGWYAGPVGWFDPSGDGELVVALRSALVAGDTATLYAGAGLVAGSDPGKEWAETVLKLRPMRRALLAGDA